MENKIIQGYNAGLISIFIATILIIMAKEMSRQSGSQIVWLFASFFIVLGLVILWKPEPMGKIIVGFLAKKPNRIGEVSK